jgi:hypothetical protein
MIERRTYAGKEYLCWGVVLSAVMAGLALPMKSKFLFFERNYLRARVINK